MRHVSETAGASAVGSKSKQFDRTKIKKSRFEVNCGVTGSAVSSDNTVESVDYKRELARML
jgi:hypothetical protein